MNRDRLLRLADHLDSVPPENFKITLWWRESPSCGTLGCAIGHGVTIFKEEGLTLEGEESFGRLYYFPRYRDKAYMEAVALFFDITEDDAEHLFTYRGVASSDYDKVYLVNDVTPKVVASHIRNFCKCEDTFVK